MVEYVGTRHSRARSRRAARAAEPLARRLDWTLVAAVAGAVAYGLWAIAGITADRARRLGGPRTTRGAVGLALVPIFLVFVQPDLGTALVYGAALAAILFVAGTPWTHIAALGAGVVVFATAVLWLLPA